MADTSQMAKRRFGNIRALIDAFDIPKGIGGTEPDWDGATDDQLELARGLYDLRRAGEQ